MSTSVDGSGPPTNAVDENDEDEVVREQLRSHGVKLAQGGVAPAVFWPALVIVAGVALFGVVAPEAAGAAFESAQSWIVVNLGWFYTLAIAFFVVLSLFIGLSRFGKVVIGRAGDEPEFGLLSWFSMLFAAGMGIGLVFYGVAEPLTFATVDPKPGTTGDEIEMSHSAMAQTLVHWGLHPWAVYVVIGLALGLAIHKRGRPVSIRWALEPLLGDRVKGRIGDLVDVLAIFGTVFGVATSLGLGCSRSVPG